MPELVPLIGKKLTIKLADESDGIDIHVPRKPRENHPCASPWGRRTESLVERLGGHRFSLARGRLRERPAHGSTFAELRFGALSDLTPPPAGDIRGTGSGEKHDDDSS
jgi:hypothetical protein